MKAAIVHDWIVDIGGAEKVLESIHKIFPVSIYTLVKGKKFEKIGLKDEDIISSPMQKLPFVQKYYRKLLDFFPGAIESFNLTEYDVILSSSHAAAKGVLTNANQLHICYIYTPMRYAWDLYFQYLKESNLEKGPMSWYAKKVLFKMRQWDYLTAARVDHFVAISHYIANRVQKVYGRHADVIYPPVDVDEFVLTEKKENFYFTASRMVPYKKMDLIVEAFSSMPDKKLVVIGNGPDYKKIAKIAKGKKNITLLGYQPFKILKEHLQNAKAFIFAAEEDFGIVPIEAQACGTPVIGFGKGGLTETIIEGKTGIFFYEQTIESLKEAVNKFENEINLDAAAIRKNSERFSKERFCKEYQEYVERKVKEFELLRNK